MKKIFLIAAICFVTKTSLAQFNTTLVMSPNPPGALLDWSRKDLTYFISGSTGVVGQGVIKTTLKTSDGNTVAATTNLAKARVITINPATGNILYAEDVIPLEVMVFNGKYKISMDRSGKLPAGSYQLCVQLVAPVTFQTLSQERCSFFTLASFQLPIPMMPANETILDIEKAKAAITFRWTPVAPRPAEMLTYRVTVFEILPNQTPMQALRSNQPLLTKDIVGTTQYIWQPQLGLTMCCPGDPGWDSKKKKDSGQVSVTMTNSVGTSAVVTGNRMEIKKDSTKSPTPEPDMDPDAYAFIWTIQTLDAQGRPFGDGNINGDGISEPNVFFIDRRPQAMRKLGPPSRVVKKLWHHVGVAK
jgi:hypothetical protein